ncbi:MAG: hypothetical protein V1789_06440 [PVC group bacterium]
MGRLDYKDFYFAPSPVAGRTRIKAIPPTRNLFLMSIDNYLAKNNRKLINVETHEGFFRVWYQEE